MANQEQINERVTELYERIERSLPGKNGEVLTAISSVRLRVIEVLEKYADPNTGRVPRSKINAVVNELPAVEDAIYRSFRDELSAALNATAATTATGLTLALISAIGVTALLSFFGLSTTMAGMVKDLGADSLGLFTGTTSSEFSDSLVRTTFNRKGPDGKRLNDRLRDVASTLRAEISTTLRESIRKGEVTSAISKRVKKKFDGLAWRSKLIVQSEVLHLHRTGVAKFAELTGIATALQIVDYPHGDPAEHRTHNCYVYAQANEYGMGKGVYPVSVKKIRHPHPNCRSTLHFVLDGRLR